MPKERSGQFGCIHYPLITFNTSINKFSKALAKKKGKIKEKMTTWPKIRQ